MATRVLVVDDERGLREMLRVLLDRNGYDVLVADGQSKATVALRKPDSNIDVVVTDLSMPDGSGMGVLEAAAAIDPSIQTVMITAYATTAQAVDAMRKGAYDYIQKPFKNDELLAVVEKATEKRRIILENRALRAQVTAGAKGGRVVGKSDAMHRIMQMVHRVANAPSSVLITGESGTGKEMVARSLHEVSNRADKPFIAINCAALPEALLESELFGHEKGAFTGAATKKDGLFRAANGGTLFLDEVGELPLALQVKLLRALQERKIRPVGGHDEIEFNVRVVAATNRNVEQEVTDGKFREDLFYRLNVINLCLPPLRERPGDISLLAEHFLIKHSAIQGKQLSFTPDAMRYVVSREYKGNVRELENVVERSVTLALDEQVTLGDLLPFSSDGTPAQRPFVQVPEAGMDLDAFLADIEQQYLVTALERCSGSRTEAGKLLGMTFRSFRYRLAKFGLGDEDSEDTP